MSAENDDRLYATWKSTHSGQDLEALLRSLEPLIQAEVGRRAGTLARDLLVIQAKKIAVDAIKSYQPSMGVKISTHVTNQLQRLSRVNYAHQNAARIPEHSMLQFHSVNIAKEDFRAAEGRDPSDEELGDALKWSPKKVQQFQSQFARSELVESIDTPGDMFISSNHDPRVDYVYMSLSPRQKQIFEMTTGYGGRKRMSNAQIQQQLGITLGTLSYEKTKLRGAFEKVI